MAEPKNLESQKMIESFITEKLCYWIGNNSKFFDIFSLVTITLFLYHYISCVLLLNLRVI